MSEPLSFSTPIAIGTFELKGQRLMVTDPCYIRGTWCQGIVDRALPGTWTAYVTYSDAGVFGPRVRSLEARNCIELPATYEIAEFGVGVDSGQAGIFDESRYPIGDTGTYGDETTFYGRCCEATLTTLEIVGDIPRSSQGDVVAEGAVARSGFGDGGYECLIRRDDLGNCVAIKIIFIDDESADDDGPELD